MLQKAHLKLMEIIVSANQKGVIDQDTKEYLINKTPKTTIFYALPKVHKKVLPPPRRPIVSGIRGSTENVGIYVDDMLRPHVQALSSYLRDTLHLLQILYGLTVPANTWLVTMDIEALFSVFRTQKA